MQSERCGVLTAGVQEFPQLCLRLWWLSLITGSGSLQLPGLAASPNKPGGLPTTVSVADAAGKPPPNSVWVSGAALAPTGHSWALGRELSGACDAWDASAPPGSLSGGISSSAACPAQAATRHGGWSPRGRVLRGQVPCASAYQASVHTSGACRCPDGPSQSRGRAQRRSGRGLYKDTDPRRSGSLGPPVQTSATVREWVRPPRCLSNCKS